MNLSEPVCVFSFFLLLYLFMIEQDCYVRLLISQFLMGDYNFLQVF